MNHNPRYSEMIMNSSQYPVYSQMIMNSSQYPVYLRISEADASEFLVNIGGMFH